MIYTRRQVFARFQILPTNPLSSKVPLHDQINQLHISDLWRPPPIRYKMLKFPAMVISFHEYGLLVQKTCDLDVIQLETDLTTFIHSI